MPVVYLDSHSLAFSVINKCNSSFFIIWVLKFVTQHQLTALVLVSLFSSLSSFQCLDIDDFDCPGSAAPCVDVLQVGQSRSGTRLSCHDHSMQGFVLLGGAVPKP